MMCGTMVYRGTAEGYAFGLYLYPKFYYQMIEKAKEQAPLETCGVIIGSYDEHMLYAHVHKLLNYSDPNECGPMECWFDVDKIQPEADEIWEKSGKTEFVIGDWHTHPGARPMPSPRDKIAWKKEAEHQENRIYVILGYDFKPEDIRVFIYANEDNIIELKRGHPSDWYKRIKGMGRRDKPK